MLPGSESSGCKRFTDSRDMDNVIIVDSKTTFKVPRRYQFIKKIGSGAYGTVASFQDTETGTQVAVKKITNAFDDLIDAKRILREIVLLRNFEHDNIIRIIDIIPPESMNFNDIYIVTDLMETDLHRVIYSKQSLTEEHCQYFVYQLLRGLKYLHSAKVIHRDLKPSNLLVNKNCDLKICDFGLSRGVEVDPNQFNRELTDYVVTRWYRPPEVILLASEYSLTLDIWSVGCIMCEIVGRSALITGKDHLDQIRRTVEITGYPSEDELSWIPEKGPARRFMTRIPISKKKDLKILFPNSSESSLDLINRMLQFDPRKRFDVIQSISHPFFESLRSEGDEPIAACMVSWKFDDFKPTKNLIRKFIFEECCKFNTGTIRGG